MGEIDSHILEFKERVDRSTQNTLKLGTLNKFAIQYTKEQIYKELIILNSKKSKSEDTIFKFIPEPTRFEFLTAIALKQSFNHLEVLPNYSIDDEGLPKSHASGNQPDILCKDSKTQSIVEVSLICGRGQVNNELLPITRHLKELIQSNEDVSSLSHFAIFVAPKIFEDSKIYVDFIAYKENLLIKNFDITEFITMLKKSQTISAFIE